VGEQSSFCLRGSPCQVCLVRGRHRKLVAHQLLTHLNPFSSLGLCCPSRETRRFGDIPGGLAGEAEEKRKELVECLSEVDDEIAEKFLNDEPLTPQELKVGLWCTGGYVHCRGWATASVGGTPALGVKVGQC